MKRKIEQLINGVFEFEVPTMILSEEMIRLTLQKDSIFRGSFTVENGAQKRMKGFIYSSNVRVTYEPADFSSIEEKIVYDVNTVGLEEGEVLEGFFSICSGIGEYKLPYHIEIKQSMIRTPQGEEMNLEEFLNLARRDFQRAYQYFVSEDFGWMIYETAPEYSSLYEGIRKEIASYRSMEEFLTGTGKKETIQIKLSEGQRVFEKVSQTTKESVVLTKSTWGFLQMDISSDADFLIINHPVVTTDEFIGSMYELTYLIDKEKLHAGKNLGRITIQSQLQTLSFEVVVHQKRQRDRRFQVQHIQEATLITDYIDFRLNKLDLNTWAKRAEDAFRKYYQACGEHTMMKLYQAQVLFAVGKEEDACLILEEIESQKDKMSKPEIFGYYLFLTTFNHKDSKYVDYIEEKVDTLFRQNRENWKLQWILLYLQEYMIQHPAEKLEAIREQYLYGCRSRIMYLEAYYIIERHPMFLKRLDEFEMKVLHFIQRKDVLTKDIAIQVTEVSGRNKMYSDELYRVLEYCYEKYPSQDIVTSICSLLIKGHKTEENYFIWYERGVEAGLRMNGLYEYYIEAMGEYRKKPLPQIIRMYFAYNNTLGYRKKASVYANVIRNRKYDEQTFQSYRPTMEKFVVDQLSAGRIDRDLAVLYKTFLTKSLMNKRMAESLGKVLFTYEINCESDVARTVIVLHRYLEQEQRVQLLNHSALIQLYTEDYQIFLEDENGLRYAASIPYTLTPIMAEPEFMEYCRELAPTNSGLVLHSSGEAEKEQRIDFMQIENFQYLLEIEEVKEAYKKRIRQRILSYYYEKPEDESLYEYLHRIDFSQFIEADKKKLIELLISVGMYKDAYTLVCDYGFEMVDPACMLKLCSRIIYDEDFGNDEMLVSLCFYCVNQEKCDETVLAYLLKYYEGPPQAMKIIWNAAGELGVDAFELEERILVYILFLRDGIQGTEEIFDSFRRKHEEKKTVRAYVIYCAYEYFVKEAEVAPLIFEYLEWECRKEELEEVCRLALLKYYAQKYVLNGEQEEYVQKALEYYVRIGMHFAFFKKFDSALIRALQIRDKTIVEYRCNPQSRVSLSYYIEYANGERSSERIEAMQHIYEGIFIKEFILFYGDRLVYHVMEEMKGVDKKTEKRMLEVKTTGESSQNTRFDLLNRISEGLDKKREEEVSDGIRTYLEQEQLINELFTLS